jgi:Phosphotransferase enzyme family
MPKRATIEILRTDLLEHRAVKAWRRLLPGRVEPESIEILRESKRKSAVYRLEGIGPRGSTVIAKRCPTATALIERTVYEEILPHLPLSAPYYYGFIKEDDKFDWLFLEDVGREQFSPLIEEHRVLAAHWLGLMHTTAAHVATTARLPDRGPDHYLEHLRSARRTILQNLTNPALNTDDIAVLKTSVSQCDALESGWNQVEECCESMPSTLVHGDFQPKNVYVRTDQAGTGLFPIDWETAGWGVPAADLAPSSQYYSGYSGQHVDLTTYWSIVREYWPSLDMSAIQQLMSAGLVFRRLAAIYWASLSLGFGTHKQLWGSMSQMRIYQAQLSEIMQEPPWAQRVSALEIH